MAKFSGKFAFGCFWWVKYRELSSTAAKNGILYFVLCYSDHYSFRNSNNNIFYLIDEQKNAVQGKKK